MIELDGSFGEGGGQILRTSLALALLTGKAFHLRHIRARRSRPGLQPQHLMSVRAAASVGGAQLRGASKDSTDLVFEPGAVRGGNYTFGIGTAGATGLVLHTLYLPLALAGGQVCNVTVTGGTHVPHSPCFHFLNDTWRHYLDLLGLRVGLETRCAGFYPRGGGTLHATIEPCPRLKGLQLTRTEPPRRATILSAVAGLPEDIADRQARQALKRLRDTRLETDVRQESWQGGPGTMLAVILNTQPVPTLFFALGERGKRAEKVADEAVEQVKEYLAAAPPGVDVHSADQLVLPLALAEGPSSYPVAVVTQHLLTNVAVIRRFLDRDIVCAGDEGKPGRVRVA